MKLKTQAATSTAQASAKAAELEDLETDVPQAREDPFAALAKATMSAEDLAAEQ